MTGVVVGVNDRCGGGGGVNDRCGGDWGVNERYGDGGKSELQVWRGYG